MSSFDSAAVRKAVEEFTSRRPQKFQDLLPARDVIAELRQKRASYRSIADLLTQHCLPTSKTASQRDELMNSPRLYVVVDRLKVVRPGCPRLHLDPPAAAGILAFRISSRGSVAAQLLEISRWMPRRTSKPTRLDLQFEHQPVIALEALVYPSQRVFNEPCGRRVGTSIRS
jgi:hypothetical protein